MRLFYGIDFPESVKTKLKALQNSLEQNGIQAGNWSDASLFHCTVLFLGELPPSSMDAVRRAGREATADVPSFTLTLADNVGAFPKNKILWIDVVKDEGWNHLSALHDATRKQIEPLGLVQLENRPYRAHITLARKLDNASVEAIQHPNVSGLSQLEGFPLSITVDQLCLFESTRINGKLTYPVAERFELKG